MIEAIVEDQLRRSSGLSMEGLGGGGGEEEGDKFWRIQTESLICHLSLYSFGKLGSTPIFFLFVSLSLFFCNLTVPVNDNSLSFTDSWPPDGEAFACGNKIYIRFKSSQIVQSNRKLDQ